MSYELHFSNACATRVSVAIAYGGGDDGSCPASNASALINRGWWNIDPGQSAYVSQIGNAVVERSDVWFYAHGSDGTTWAGNDWGPTYLPSQSFYNCEAIRSTDASAMVSLRRIHFSARVHTVRLTY
jgi:hypothetical protein